MIVPPRLDHLETLLDDVGVLQHATFDVAAREHGYCLDDNARGLVLATALLSLRPDSPVARRLRGRTAAFLQHAWNRNAGRFRNFMGFDRRWLEEAGSEDCQGRAVWALGVARGEGHGADARDWAETLLGAAAERLPELRSPRALAFGLLGLSAGGEADRWRPVAERLADRLLAHLADERRPGWCWFEAALNYDNARLPHGLLAAGRAFRRPDWSRAGRDALRWLCASQRGAAGRFRPIGSNGFWRRGGAKARFDQQPIEAAATVAAAVEAWRDDGDEAWLDEARRAHAWFGGANDLGAALAVPDTGGCRDGLHPDRVNGNQGAESTLAWLQADLDLRRAEADRVATAVLTAPTGRAA